MIERIKTIVLILLVLNSFYLTYLLWWGNPSFETLEAQEYQEPTYIGKQKTWKQLMQPSVIYFHFEENRHTKATSETSVYKILWESIQKWQFKQPQKVTLTYEEVHKIVEEYNGLEVVFNYNLPISFFNEILQIPIGMTLQMEYIQRIWIYESEAGEYVALFIDDDARIMVQTSIESNSTLNLRNLILLGSQLPEVEPIQYASEIQDAIGISLDFFNIIYLPKDRTYMNQWTYEAAKIDMQDMIRALFIDVSAVKEIRERTNSTIITDGTKSMQYKEEENEIRFYLPTYSQGSNERPTYFPILDFINNHHGWTGEYRVYEWMSDDESQGIQFREYVHGFPVYGESTYPYLGQMVVKYRANQVNEYSRGLIQMITPKRGFQVSVLSGTELMDYLRSQRIYMFNVQSIELGYKVTLHTQTMEVELIPHYIVYLKNDTAPMMVDARVRQSEE